MLTNISKFSAVLTIFFFTSFVRAVVSVMLGPLFPPEAEYKGLTPHQYGLISGLPGLACLVVLPVLGHFIDRFPLRGIFVWANFLQGLFPLGIAAADYTSNFFIYVGISIVCRLWFGLSSLIVNCSMYSLCFNEFPQRSSTAIGISKCGYIFGTCLGPIIGTALSTVIGFYWTFTIAAIVQFLLGLVAIIFLPPMKVFVMPSRPLTFKETTSLYWRLVSNKTMALFILGMVLTEMNLFYIPTILEPGLRIYNLTANQVGLMFLAAGIFELLTPVWGVLIDTTLSPNVVLIIGFLTTAIGIGIFAPVPLVPAIQVLVVIGLCIYGLGQGIVLVSSLCCFEKEFNVWQSDTIEKFRLRQSQSSSEVMTLTDPTDSQNLVTVVYAVSASFGYFIGAASSATFLELVGFSNSMCILVGINVTFVIFLGLYLLVRSTRESVRKVQSEEVCPLLLRCDL